MFSNINPHIQKWLLMSNLNFPLIKGKTVKLVQ